MRKIITLLLPFFLLPVLCSSQKPAVSFGIMTDVHYADKPDQGHKAYNKSLEKLQACIETMNRDAVDFIVELGDFKDMPDKPSEEKTLVYLFRVEKVFSGFKGPKYHVLGNHDEDCITKAQFYSIARNTGISQGRTYYSFDCKGFHFVVLDSNFDSAGKDFERGKFSWEDTNIPETELKWLKKDLKNARGPAFVFTHQLLDGNDHYTVRNSKKVRDILEHSGKVKAVFQGHYHEGQYRMIKGIHYYTLKAMVDGLGDHDNSYAIVSVSDDFVTVKGFGNAVSINFGINR